MNDKVKYSLLIDRYLNGEMDDAGKSAFEKELLENRELQQELKLEEDILRILSMEDVLDFRMKISQVIREARETERKGKVITISRNKAIFAAAAVVVLIIVTSAVYFLSPRSQSSDRLFAMYYDSDKPIRVLRSDDGNLVEALMYYQQRNFNGAIELFNKVLETDPDNAAIRFYTGISYIETAQYKKAIESFQYIIDENDNLYIEASQWHLGLCYLKIDELTNAQKQFKHIASDQRNFYNEDANKILIEIAPDFQAEMP